MQTKALHSPEVRERAVRLGRESGWRNLLRSWPTVGASRKVVESLCFVSLAQSAVKRVRYWVPNRLIG